MAALSKIDKTFVVLAVLMGTYVALWIPGVTPVQACTIGAWAAAARITYDLSRK